MKKRTKRWIGALALVTGALGAVGAIMVQGRRKANRTASGDVWARPGMSVTFRAELMPGVVASGRTFEVAKLLPGGRVMLDRIAGEHAENEFEPLKR